MNNPQLCEIDGCGKPRQKREWCGAHYRRRMLGLDMTKPLRSPPGSKNAWLEAHAQYDGDDCLRWPFAYNPNGYGEAVHNRKVTSANRVMCILAHGEPPTPEHESAHSCGNGKGGCLNPRHLDWLTSKQNQCDRTGHTTDNRGLRAHANKLSEHQVRDIRAMQGHASPKDVGQQYGVTKTAIQLIWKRKNWAWLE